MDRTGSVSTDEDAYTFPTSLDIYLDAGRSTAKKQSSAFSVKQVRFPIHFSFTSNLRQASSSKVDFFQILGCWKLDACKIKVYVM